MRIKSKIIKAFRFLYFMFLLVFSIYFPNLIDPQPGSGNGYVHDYIEPVCNNEFCIYGVVVYTDNFIHTADTFIYLSKSPTYARKDMILRYGGESGYNPFISMKNSHAVEIFEGHIGNLTKFKRHVNGVRVEIKTHATYNDMTEEWISHQNKIIALYAISVILFSFLFYHPFIRIIRLIQNKG